MPNLAGRRAGLLPLLVPNLAGWRAGLLLLVLMLLLKPHIALQALYCCKTA